MVRQPTCSGGGRSEWGDFDDPIGLEFDVEGESPEEAGSHEGRRRGLGHKDLAGRPGELGLGIVHRHVAHTTIREGHLGNGGLWESQRLNPWPGKGELSVEPSVADGVNLQRSGRAPALSDLSGTPLCPGLR